ncbi:MAG: type II toxin-antitoxin system RelE/ParE family toxin [Paludibacteraceae bacterium]|nr:type II toxin-antitoxin system RelE/ParE family toxin [Paludibacteraceae bacterium]
MNPYNLTKQAVSDLENIWTYTYYQWSEKQADSYYQLLTSTFEKIASIPLAYGKQYDHVMVGLRGCKVKQHIIFYIIQPNNSTLIVRILHASMDFKRYF